MVTNLISCYSGQFFLPVPDFDFHELGGMARALSHEGWGKKVIEYLSFPHIPSNQLCHFLLERSHILPSFPFIIVVPIEVFFCCPLWPWADAILDFPDLIPVCSDSVSVFSQGYLFLFPPSLGFLFEFGWKLLVHPCRPPGVFASELEGGNPWIFTRICLKDVLQAFLKNEKTEAVFVQIRYREVSKMIVIWIQMQIAAFVTVDWSSFLSEIIGGCLCMWMDVCTCASNWKALFIFFLLLFI